MFDYILRQIKRAKPKASLFLHDLNTIFIYKNEDVVGIISSRSNNRETRKNYAILSSFGLNIEKTIKSIKIEQEKAKHIQEEKSKIEIPKDEELVYDDSSYDDLE